MTGRWTDCQVADALFGSRFLMSKMDQLVYQLETKCSTWQSLHRCSLGLHQSCHISLCSRFHSEHLLLTRKLSRSGFTATRHKSCFWPHEWGQNTYLPFISGVKSSKQTVSGKPLFFCHVILDTKTRKLSLASASLRYTIDNAEEQDSSLSQIQGGMLQGTPSQFQSWGWTSLSSPT